MTQFTAWFSPAVMRSLGWALVHFVWEGLALAALLSVGLSVARRATSRYALALATLLLMVVAPLATFVLLRQAAVAAPTVAVSSAAAPLASHWAAGHVSVASAPIPAAPNPSTPSGDVLLLLVEAWFAGVALFSLRTAGGLLLIEGIRRRESKPLSAALRERCLQLQRRLRIDRVIRYCECLRLEAPAVIGWFRPVVLLPITALTGLSPEQLDAVIAHELAHIRRLDCFVNLFQIAAETLLFYHPAVWWVSKRIRAERENCCDDAAISVCDDAVEYARALTLMEEWRQAPTLAMAANRGPLATRVARLLGLATFGNGIRSAGFAASFLCLAGALLAGNAFLGVAHTSLAMAMPAYLSGEVVNSTAHSSAATMAPLPIARHAALAAHSLASQTAAQSATVSASEAKEQDAQSEGQNNKESYIDGLKSAGLENLTIDEIVSMKVQGITPDYVRAIHALGLKPSPDDLIGMEVQGVTPEYIKQMRAAGFNVNTDELIGMKVQGVTPEYIQQMKDLGVQADADGLIGMRVQGVTPEYIKEMRAAGINVKADEYIGMKVQGITPDYVKQMKDMGVQADADELIGMRVQGVTPEYIKEMRADGYNAKADEYIGMKTQGVTPAYIQQMKDLGLQADADDLIAMRVQGVTPEYIKEMRAAGFNVKAEDYIGMKVQGVTLDYVKSLQQAGLGKLDNDDVIEAKVQGVTPEFIEKVRQHGFHDLTLRKLIALKHAGIF
jgi:beta-lactamase regulating signal transducer with metallopeptidase domain